MMHLPPAPTPVRAAARARASRVGGDGHRFGQRVILHAVSTVLLLLAAHAGLAGWTSSLVTLAYAWGGLLIFFAILRSGWSSGRPDPGLSFAQLMFAISVVVLSYGLIDIARGAALQFLCLLLALGMARLTMRQLMGASCFAVLMLALTSAARIAVGAGAGGVHAEVYNLLMAAVLLPVAIIVGGEIGRLYRRQATQRSKLASTLQKLTVQSLTDRLTGLPNRRHMLQMIHATRVAAQASGNGYCLAMLDIDWFKRVNDVHGHAIGDRVLRDFAALTGSALENCWKLGRWGGEEFLILMPDCSALQAHAILEGCRRRIESHRWLAPLEGASVTFSAGITSSGPAESIDATLQRADLGLYLAKANGRNRTEIFVGTIGQAEMASFCPPGMPSAAARSHARPAGSAQHSPRLPSTSDRSEAAGKRHGDNPGGETLRDAPGVVAWLASIVLSNSPDRRENLRLPLIACALHGVWIAAACLYAVPNGLIQAWAAWVVVAYESLSAIGFYVAIRSGWSRRFADGGLVLTQMLAASAMASFGYITAPELRPSILHMLCVIQVFGMATLKPAEASAAGTAAVAMLCAVIVSLFAIGPPDLHAEILKLLLACTIVLQLSRLSRDYSFVRERVAEDRLKLQETVARVNEEATRDALTGLPNRSFMEEALAERLAAWRAGGPAFCLGILDLDHFKRVNDQKGHQAGDAVLIALAQASRQSFRGSDLLCRWGGEEFMCLLPDAGSEETTRAAMQRLRSAFSEALAGVPGLEWAITFSSGFASPCDGVTPDELVAQADRALYSAKQDGRDRDVFARRGALQESGLPS
jgi:diguanylate cyclase (GGDEF)-like protein